MLQAPRRMRWLMIGLAFAATVVNYLDRQTLSVVAPVLRVQLHFGDVEYSRIVGAFLLAYTIANGVSGPLIDRLGTRWGYALSMAVWSAAGVAHAFARTPVAFGFCRLLLGAGEAGNWPAAVKLVSEWFPASERALACGIFNSGAAIGAVIAPPLVAWIVLRSGWPAAFLSMGAIGFIWLAVWLRVYRTPPEALAEVRRRSPPAWSVLRQRFVWSLMVAKIFFDPAWYFYIFWFPQFLSTVHHFDLAKIGLYAWIPFLTADLGNLAGGAYAAWILRRGLTLRVARASAFAIFCGLMTSAIPAVLVHDARLAVALVSVATFGYTGSLANMLALPADSYPKNVLGSIWGLASMGAGFGGMVFTLVTGWLLSAFSYIPVFILFGTIPLIAMLILLFVTLPARPLLEATGEAA
jgi:MFS transporter, ACS family, hexuronate transporter